jgi:hypothetical protein
MDDSQLTEEDWVRVLCVRSRSFEISLQKEKVELEAQAKNIEKLRRRNQELQDMVRLQFDAPKVARRANFKPKSAAERENHRNTPVIAATQRRSRDDCSRTGDFCARERQTAAGAIQAVILLLARVTIACCLCLFFLANRHSLTCKAI